MNRDPVDLYEELSAAERAAAINNLMDSLPPPPSFRMRATNPRIMYEDGRRKYFAFDLQRIDPFQELPLPPPPYRVEVTLLHPTREEAALFRRSGGVLNIGLLFRELGAPRDLEKNASLGVIERLTKGTIQVRIDTPLTGLEGVTVVMLLQDYVQELVSFHERSAPVPPPVTNEGSQYSTADIFPDAERQLTWRDRFNVLRGRANEAIDLGLDLAELALAQRGNFKELLKAFVESARQDSDRYLRPRPEHDELHTFVERIDFAQNGIFGKQGAEAIKQHHDTVTKEYCLTGRYPNRPR